MPSFDLTRYNEAQRECVLHEGSPLLGIAGAGTGKTTMLVGRIAYQMHSGISPESMIMMTFTNKAARNMQERLKKIDPAAERILAGTFHGVALKLLMAYGPAQGLFSGERILGAFAMQKLWEKSFEAVFSEQERSFLRKLRLGGISRLQHWYSRIKTNGMSVAALYDKIQELGNWNAFREGTVTDVFANYERLKKENQALDFDDLLLRFRRLLDTDAAASIQKHFRHFYVDEFQDTSRLQASILYALVGDSKNLTVVGDPSQSIYSFMSANVGNILEFQEQYPDAHVVKLPLNYRSSQSILNLANKALIGCRETIHNPLEAHSKEGARVLPHVHKYGSEFAEAKGIMRDLQSAISNGTPLSQIAVLSRQSATTLPLESMLTQEGLAYVKYGGQKFIDKKNIRQFLSFLELGVDPRNKLAWEVILPMCPLIGDEYTKHFLDWMDANPEWKWDTPPALFGGGKRNAYFLRFWQILSALAALDASDPADYAKKALGLFAPLFHLYWEGASSKDKSRLLSDDALSEDPALPQGIFNFDAAPVAAPMVNTLSEESILLAEIEDFVVKQAAQAKDMRSYLNGFSLDDSLAEDEEDRIVVSTIHSAKGLEWDVVFVVGIEEGTLPPKPRRYGEKKGIGEDYPEINLVSEAPYIEEEKRLFYVALTRAAKELHLCFSSRRRGEGLKDSRFIKGYLPRPLCSGTVDFPSHRFTLEKMSTDVEAKAFAAKA